MIDNAFKVRQRVRLRHDAGLHRAGAISRVAEVIAPDNDKQLSYRLRLPSRGFGLHVNADEIEALRT
ncbi:MAG TPA: hypothetical protein VGL75_11835 [Acidothermaceae bacterium]|jgi:hypothetical protein